jgi:hypothetical protein
MNDNKKIVKNSEVEQSLAHLYFYTKLSTYIYKDYKDKFDAILQIIEKWISYYAMDGNLLRITEEDAKEILIIRDSIPSDAYSEVCFEEVVNFIDIILYYASVPINEEFNENDIKVKGRK